MGGDGLRILGPAAFRPTLETLATRFAEMSGLQATTVLGPATGNVPASVTSRLAAGQKGEVAFLPSVLADAQIAEGRLSAVGRFDAMRSMVALCVKEGAPIPDISTPAALRSALLAAGSIGISLAASGVFFRDTLLPRLDLAETLAGRCRVIAGCSVGEAVARDEVDMGVQQLSELIQETGIVVAGPLPASLQGFTIITAAPLFGQEARPEVVQFLAFLRSPAAMEIMEMGGLQPVPADDGGSIVG